MEQIILHLTFRYKITPQNKFPVVYVTSFFASALKRGPFLPSCTLWLLGSDVLLLSIDLMEEDQEQGRDNKRHSCHDETRPVIIHLVNEVS